MAASYKHATEKDKDHSDHRTQIRKVVLLILLRKDFMRVCIYENTRKYADLEITLTELCEIYHVF